MLHEMAVGTVAENRWYGGQFLLEAADHVRYSQIEDLFVAAARLAAEHDLMWQVWDAAGGNGNPDAWAKLAEPAVRRKIVPLILAGGQGYGRGGASGAHAGLEWRCDARKLMRTTVSARCHANRRSTGYRQHEAVIHSESGGSSRLQRQS